jgi:hypothetical protein
VRRLTGLLFASLLCAACAAPAATSAPSPSASAAPSATPTAPPASASTSPSPAATTTLTIDWHAEDVSGIDEVESIIGVATAGDTYVLLTSLQYVEEGSPNSSVSWSNGGTAWTLGTTFPVSNRMLALAAGGPGFVAAGMSEEGSPVWTSADGRRWEPVNDSSLDKAVINQLVATDSGLVGFGWRSDTEAPGIWTSADGAEWLAATNETGMTVAKGLQALGAYDGRAIAFVSEGEEEPPAIWETTGRAEWIRSGVLTEVASISRVAGGDRGWVALGDNRAWTSADGMSWGEGVPGPDVDSDVVVDDAGYVAVGFIGSLPGETCGDQRPFAGHTWTSADGKIWQVMPVTDEFESAMVTKLLVVDRTLVGYGQRIPEDASNGLPVAQWTDTLPDVSDPGDASDEASVPKTCGG